MNELSGLTVEEQKKVAQNAMIVVVGALVTGFVTVLWLVPDSLSSAMKSGASAFTALVNILPVVYVANCISGAILCEIADSRAKKRPFRIRNVIIFLLLLGEYFLGATVLLTVFEFFFSTTSYLIQFPLVAISLTLPLLAMVGTTKVERIHTYMKKAFE